MDNCAAKILFIDDETAILDALQGLMVDETWDCRFAASGAEALAVLKTEHFDLVVSDIGMPEINGIELAKKIRQDYPQIVRIFLSNGVDQKLAVTALAEGYTQQIVPKPWNDQELKEIIRSALRQQAQQQKHSSEFQALINSIPLLPTLPESYSNVRSCIVGDEVDIEKMADYISRDVSISSLLLHWANSALFGQRFQVDTIKKAIIVLGTDIVENLVLSEAVNRNIAGALPDLKGFDFKKFKKHSMATAVIARLLIKSIYSSDYVKHDRAFIAGLLHDIGKLAAASFFPKRFEQAIAVAIRTRCSLSDAEYQVYGTDHAEIGAFLAEWWALPPFIFNAIHRHHQPYSSPVDQDVIAAAHVANLLSYQFHYGSNGDTLPRTISDEYRGKFYLSEEATEILRAETDKTLSALNH